MQDKIGLEEHFAIEETVFEKKSKRVRKVRSGNGLLLRSRPSGRGRYALEKTPQGYTSR
jgi:hypothetical protein